MSSDPNHMVSVRKSGFDHVQAYCSCGWSGRRHNVGVTVAMSNAETDATTHYNHRDEVAR